MELGSFLFNLYIKHLVSEKNFKVLVIIINSIDSPLQKNGCYQILYAAKIIGYQLNKMRNSVYKIRENTVKPKHAAL